MLGVVCALIALPIGVALVETPYRVAEYLDRRRLKTASSAALKADLDAAYRHYGHLNILRELRLRGESIEFELPRLVGFLVSPSVVNRAVGCAGLKELFPAIGQRLANYNPFPEEAQFDPIVRQLIQEYPSKA
jgi:hypothetical protein